MRIFIIYLVLIGLLIVTGCSTVLNGKYQEIGIATSPPGASITVDGKECGVTPAFVKVKRAKHHILRLQKDGYEIYETAHISKLEPWVWGNLIFGGPGGVLVFGFVDWCTGAIHKIDPKCVNVQLAKK